MWWYQLTITSLGTYVSSHRCSCQKFSLASTQYTWVRQSMSHSSPHIINHGKSYILVFSAWKVILSITGKHFLSTISNPMSIFSTDTKCKHVTRQRHFKNFNCHTWLVARRIFVAMTCVMRKKRFFADTPSLHNKWGYLFLKYNIAVWYRC